MKWKSPERQGQGTGLHVMRCYLLLIDRFLLQDLSDACCRRQGQERECPCVYKVSLKIDLSALCCRISLQASQNDHLFVPLDSLRQFKRHFRSSCDPWVKAGVISTTLLHLSSFSSDLLKNHTMTPSGFLPPLCVN